MERYDYRKLLGKMREQKVTQEVLAEKVGISATSMNLSLNNKRDFRQEEILVICESLDISGSTSIVGVEKKEIVSSSARSTLGTAFMCGKTGYVF